MDIALISAAGLMGLVGSPHCTAMCAAPCAGVAQRCAGAGRLRGALIGLLAGRLAGYMAAGAVVAASVAALGELGRIAPALRPAWALVHMAALGLGAWMLVGGRMPAGFGWAEGATRVVMSPPIRPGWQRMSGPLRAGTAGTLWFVLPCGLLQAALIVAALANGPVQGAAAMGAFAATSSIGLVVHPLLWSHAFARPKAGVWVVRASGAALVAGSAWALGHGLWERVVALCA